MKLWEIKMNKKIKYKKSCRYLKDFEQTAVRSIWKYVDQLKKDSVGPLQKRIESLEILLKAARGEIDHMRVIGYTDVVPLLFKIDLALKKRE